MTDVRPELVFVAGPQRDERAVLMSNLVVAGRSPTAEVRITEQHASREHVRFTLTADGWVMENLSPNGTRVNGKRFKSPKKKVLLGTGDVLGVGLETEILFVSPGDDPTVAVQAYRKTHPLPVGEQAPEVTESAQVTPVPIAAPPPRDAYSPAEPPAGEPLPSGKPEQTTEDRKRRAWIKKFAVGYAIFIAAVVGLIVLLLAMRKEDAQKPGPTKFLSDKTIADILSEVPSVGNPIPARAVAELREARGIYANLPSKPGDLYRCVRGYHLYLAYKRDPGVFESVQDERNYQRSRMRLIELVRKTYRNAWAREQAGDWGGSAAGYRELLQIVPEQRRDNPVQDRLRRNVRDHVVYVRGKMETKRRR